MLDCCIIAIILKQFPLCDSKGIQGACTFKVNCNHCAGIIKKCTTITENYKWKQWIYQIKGSPPPKKIQNIILPSHIQVSYGNRKTLQ